MFTPSCTAASVIPSMTQLVVLGDVRLDSNIVRQSTMIIAWVSLYRSRAERMGSVKLVTVKLADELANEVLQKQRIWRILFQPR